LAYLQRILGYSITGHILNQVMQIMIGEGGAGKSLLLALLKRVMGPFYKDVSKDMLVTSKRQRPLGKGAANPDEAGEQANKDLSVVLLRTLSCKRFLQSGRNERSSGLYSYRKD
jgi:ABC-type enterochelin transport system ATPase subunit